ncbi:MAG TPA: hypothetical protein VFC47_11395 [Caulobacteraceae bacterium]|nr:hypothetical protein [Caulobacteraceae bacterium]
MIWRTALAAVVAPLIWALVTTVALLPFAYLGGLMRDPLITLGSAIAANLVGMGAARWVCDRLFRPYLVRLIFVVIAALLAIETARAAVSMSVTWGGPLGYAEVLVSLGVAYAMFWQWEDGFTFDKRQHAAPSPARLPPETHAPD